MWKRIVLLGAMAALTIVKPSNAVAQSWDGCCGISVNVRVPFPRQDFCCERRFFPRRVDCCEERRFFPRQVDCCEERRFFPRQVDCCEERRFFPGQVDCCEERRFFPRQVDCCEERRFFPRPVFCCDDRRFFPRPFGRPPYYYGDRFAPYAYNWNAGYTDAGYGY
jgi:hypothetical protein